MISMTNNEVRTVAREKGVPLWKVADAMRISEATLTRKLRHELTDHEKRDMLKLIESLRKER